MCVYIIGYCAKILYTTSQEAPNSVTGVQSISNKFSNQSRDSHHTNPNNKTLYLLVGQASHRSKLAYLETDNKYIINNNKTQIIMKAQ